ncbi:MAG: class I SAM-dependent methyltransferase [Planctomycetota bacterium]|nr:class I SAM-dependent methyltransferase [Planctomycetota bacterium]
MRAGWHFLEADETERATLSDRGAALALPHELAAPQNRSRRVWRIAHAGRVWFLKEFGPTSWKNRLRFATSPPVARDDAERELLMTMALRQEGVETPRPVAYGRNEQGSVYLCAEMPGRSLRDVLLDGKLPQVSGQLVASFCGDILKKGFHLPDLSAEHVFVRHEIGFDHFGLLDLHNGTRRPPGPPPLRLCRRVLRHFAQSVQELGISQHAALRFAVRLLRSAGHPGQTRRVLRNLPPFDTARRYERPGKSRAYADRNRRRTERELDLLDKVWPGQDGETVLDIPCGAGRLTPFLHARGHRVLWADGALAMLREARAHHGPVPALRMHALALPLRDNSVDGVVQFRFLHHLPRKAAKTAVTEACRVARRFVVFSFFHPCSTHHLRRRSRDLWRRRAPTRFALTLGQIENWCQKNGFQRHAVAADMPYLRDLWVVAFARQPS